MPNSMQAIAAVSVLIWTQHYQYIDSYKPTLASYEAIKTIPINIVVFGEDDGSLFPFHIGQDMPNMASYFDPSGVEIPNPYITTSANVNFFEGWLNQANVNTAAPSGNGIYFNGPGTADDVPYTFQICNPGFHFKTYCSTKGEIFMN